MKEKLYIKNFAGIKEAEIELNKINILIGPQATGKSVIAKLAYISRKMCQDIVPSIMKSLDYSKYIEEINEDFLGFFPLKFLESSSFFISYTNNDLQINISYTENQGIYIKLPDIIEENYNDALVNYKDIDYDNGTSPFPGIDKSMFNAIRAVAISDKINSIFDFRNNEQIYIPAGRAIFNLITGRMFSFMDDIRLDPTIKKFGIFYELLLDSFDLLNPDKITPAVPSEIASFFLHDRYKVLEQIMGGTPFKQNGNIYIRHSDGRQVRLDYSSSGQQEIMPLVSTLYYTKNRIGDIVYYIEEPEAHVFPSTQKALIELVSTIYNTRKNKSQLIITTHSPYILTSFNNLMEAGNVEKKILAEGDDEKLKKLYDIIPKEQILNPEDVSAFSVTHDEKEPVKLIIDKDSGLIMGDEIDDVSEETSVQFNKLLDLEF